MNSSNFLSNLKGQKANVKPERIPTLETKSEGKYVIRFFPNKNDPEGAPYAKTFTHFGFTHPNFPEGNSAFNCAGRGCPLCKIAKEKEDAGDADAWGYKAKVAFNYYVVDASGNLMILRSSGEKKGLQSEIVAEASALYTSEGVNIFDLETGRQVEIVKRGQRIETKWKANVHDLASPISKELIERWKASPELDKLYKQYTVEELQRVADGVLLDLPPRDGYRPDSATRAEPKPAPAATAPVAAKEKAPEAGKLSLDELRKAMLED